MYERGRREEVRMKGSGGGRYGGNGSGSWGRLNFEMWLEEAKKCGMDLMWVQE